MRPRDRLLDYLFRVQQKPRRQLSAKHLGRWRVIGDGLQMDQVALPLVLAYQLERHDRETWLKHIKPAADLIVKRGPLTDQDRWEEKSGYFPATVAAEIAGLVCAAEIAKINGDTDSARHISEDCRLAGRRATFEADYDPTDSP